MKHQSTKKILVRGEVDPRPEKGAAQVGQQPRVRFDECMGAFDTHLSSHLPHIDGVECRTGYRRRTRGRESAVHFFWEKSKKNGRGSQGEEPLVGARVAQTKNRVRQIVGGTGVSSKHRTNSSLRGKSKFAQGDTRLDRLRVVRRGIGVWIE